MLTHWIRKRAAWLGLLQPLRIGASAIALAFLVTEAGADQKLMSKFAAMRCSEPYKIDRRAFKKIRRIEEPLERTLSIEGPDWNDTILDGCEIRNPSGSGIEIRNVKNFAVTNCSITGATGTGIRVRSSGATQNVQIVDNVIMNVGDNGISAAKRVKDNVDHTGLVIAGNMVIESGTRGQKGRDHGIYSQVSDAVIFGNEISGTRDGNGISIRSSGIVACNKISGRSKADKPGIRYFADNYTGPSRRLIIANNVIRDASPAVHLRKPDGWTKKKPEALVMEFVITGNSANSSPTVKVAKFWSRNEDVSLEIERNRKVE